MSITVIQLPNGTQYNLIAPSNGLNLTTAAASVSTTMDETVAKVTNPFTQQTQTQNWAGGDLWSFTVTLPPMTRAQVAPWLAFLGGLRGINNVFQLGDPFGQQPMGSVAGSPVIAAATNAGVTSIATNGWTPNAHNVLLAGDFIQIGYRLHMVTDDSVSANANGSATFNIWPSLRDNCTVNTEIVTSQTTGLFRLSDNKRSYHTDWNNLITLSFGATEVR